MDSGNGYKYFDGDLFCENCEAITVGFCVCESEQDERNKRRELGENEK